MTDNISVNYKSRLYVKPRIDHQLLGISDDYLVVQHFNINLLLSMGWGGALFFWLIGLPGFIFSLISPLLPPYGYRNGVKIETVSELLRDYDFSQFNYFGYFLVVFILGGMFLAITIGFSYFNLRAVKKAYSPITFNRKKQTVSIFYNGEKEEIEWSRISCTIKKRRYTSGYVVHQSMVLQINNLWTNPKIKTQIEGSLFVDALDDGDHDGAEANWEYIRQFMEQGPENLKIPALPIIGLDHLDKQPMYSYNFKDSLKGHWFWPILKKKDRHGITVFFTFLFWPIKVAFFIPNLLTDWLWRKMCLGSLKDSTATPSHSLKDCGREFITANDAEKVITIEEASVTKDLSYAEVKRRLQG